MQLMHQPVLGIWTSALLATLGLASSLPLEQHAPQQSAAGKQEGATSCRG